MLDRPNYKTVETSWIEKRDDIDQGIASLPSSLRDQALRNLAELKPVPPAVSALKPHQPDRLIESAHFVVGLDAGTGAIHTLRSKASNRDWASPANPLALFAYQTLSKHDYDRFLATYVTSKADWAPKDFGKPNIEHFGAQSRTWTPKLTNCWTGEDAQGSRIVAKLAIVDSAAERSGLVAWPQDMYLEIVLPNQDALVHVNFSWFQKKSNRLPEALWLTFHPNAREVRNWVLEKVDRAVSPFDVVSGGNRHMHALSKGLTYKDHQGSFSIETLDAPVITIGERSPIAFSKDQPDLAQGIHFSLFNNAWGTNYIQWFGEDMRFRFTLEA
jgi:hypothetical protein